MAGSTPVPVRKAAGFRAEGGEGTAWEGGTPAKPGPAAQPHRGLEQPQQDGAYELRGLLLAARAQRSQEDFPAKTPATANPRLQRPRPSGPHRQLHRVPERFLSGAPGAQKPGRAGACAQSERSDGTGRDGRWSPAALGPVQGLASGAGRWPPGPGCASGCRAELTWRPEGVERGGRRVGRRIPAEHGAGATRRPG